MSDCILIVDDDVVLAQSVDNLLQSADYETLIANTAEDGYTLALTGRPNLALLDIMVPVMGGLELCQRIREQSQMPIIFLTALGAVESVVNGLELGADDYLVKPFQPPILLARIKAHLRRAALKSDRDGNEDLLTLAHGALRLDLKSHELYVHGQAVELTPREFDLMRVLTQNAGRVMTAQDLTEQAWGIKPSDSRQASLKLYIHYLRKKIEDDPASPRWLQTVRGVGYRFEDE